MVQKAKESYTPATTPADNGYDPQCGNFDPCYSGDLNTHETDDEERDAKYEAQRKESTKAVPAGDGPALSPGHDLD
jgi:hypothetical protein